MDWNQITATSALTAVMTAIVTWLARPYFDAYLRKKGEQKAVLEDLDRINRKLEEIRSDFVERSAYLAEKGKTAATKEDVEEINRKIESVRSEYVRTIELLKWQLSKRATLHRLQVEKEFEVFSIIWEAAVDLRFATQKLRPILEYIDPDESEEARWQRKFGAFSERRNLFLEAMEKQRIFYPSDIYDRLKNLLERAGSEMIDCQTALASGEGRMPPRSYLQAQENHAKLIQTIDSICDTLRSRLSETAMSDDVQQG